MRQISAVAALGRNRAIGKDGALPWDLPEDMAFFRAVTLDKVMVVGRTTYECIGQPLPRRRTVVLSRRPAPEPLPASVSWFHDVDELLAAFPHEAEIMVAGGAEIYALLMPYLTRQYLTEIEADFEGDTFYPEWDRSQWREVERRAPQQPAQHPFHFVTYERISPPT